MGRIFKIGTIVLWFFLFNFTPSVLAQSSGTLIYDVSVSDVSENTAKIIWTSSDANQLSVINFVYGLSTSYDKKGYPRSLSNSVAGQKMYFETNLSNLEGGKTYYFKIQTSDSKSSEAYAGSFSTLIHDITKPIVTNITATPGTENATVSWKTDEPANSSVEYYESGGNVIVKSNTDYVTNHDIFIGGLDAGTSYYYKIRSSDKSGNESISDISSFVTISKIAPPQNVSDLRTVSDNNSITLKWKIPVSSGFSGVEVYKNTGSPASRNNEKVYLGKGGSYVDTDVSPARTYYYAVFSKNDLGEYSSGVVVAASVAAVVPSKLVTTAVSETPSTTKDTNLIGDKLGVDKLMGGEGKAEESVKKIVAPTLAGVTLVNIFSSISIINLLPLIHLLLFEPFVFIGRRKRIGWGRVYNSITKHPVDLAVVRLIDKQTGKTVQSKVTDYEGRFAFSAKPGEYIIRVSKDKFTFPSAYLRGLRDDGPIFDIYFGRTFDISRSDSLITANIPIDPPGDHELPFRFKILGMLTVVQGVLSWIGLPITFIALLVSTAWYMWLLLAFQLVLFSISRRISRPVRVKNWGIIYDANTKKPIERAIVRLYNQNHDRLAGTQLTDQSGRYHFLAGNGKYYIVAEEPSHEVTRTPAINLMDRRKQSITLDIGLNSKTL